MLETLNLAATVLTLAMVLIGAPVLFRRQSYPWNKVMFGTVTALIVTMGLIVVLSTIQSKSGLSVFPLLWLAPVAVGIAGVKGRRAMADFHQSQADS